MNYIMAAPIQAAFAGDPRVRFYATSTRAPAADVRAIYRGALPGTRVISPRAAALKRFDVYLSADLLWATLPRGTARIQMFHGVAGKFQHDYDTPSSSMRRWHRFFFVNRRRLRNFVRPERLTPRATHRGSSACPRWTAWSTARCSATTCPARLCGSIPTRPTILYAPTWSAASSLNLMGLELVDGLLDAILERDREAARSFARPAAVLLRRCRLAGPSRRS